MDMNLKNINKKKIIENICYTELVYNRINKKLGLKYSCSEIEKFILNVLLDSDEYTKLGKNYYVSNTRYKVKLTINSNTYRIITAEKIL